MEQALALTLIAFLGNKIIEFVKDVRNKDWNAAVTLLAIHGAGVIVMLFAAAASVTETIILPGTSAAIGTLDSASVIFLGLVMSSFTSKLYDFQKAVDGSDSAKQPPLLGPDHSTPVP